MILSASQLGSCMGTVQGRFSRTGSRASKRGTSFPRSIHGVSAVAELGSSSNGSFVTERDRRTAAKAALYRALPVEPLSTNFPAQVKECVGERLLVLEHLCPISDPARQSLDGSWEVLYLNTITPGLIAARVLQSLPFPKHVVQLEQILLQIKGQEIKAVAKVKIMDSTYAELKLVSSWVPESDIRVREVYQKGSLEFPDLGSEEMMGEALRSARQTAPSQIHDMVQRALSTATPILQSVSKGFEIPVSNSYERTTLVSYLDEDLMVARSLSGTPEILRRLPDAVVPPEMSLEMEDAVDVFSFADNDVDAMMAEMSAPPSRAEASFTTVDEDNLHL